MRLAIPGRQPRSMGKHPNPRGGMAIGARSYRSYIAGLTITAYQVPSRISCRKTSPQPNEPDRKLRREYHDTLLGRDGDHRCMVVIATKADGQALVGGGRNRRLPRHRRILPACSKDWIGGVSCCRRVPVCALDRRLLHANEHGGLEATARAEAAVAQHGRADLEQCGAPMGTGSRPPAPDVRP